MEKARNARGIAIASALVVTAFSAACQDSSPADVEAAMYGLGDKALKCPWQDTITLTITPA
jgi:hypothetical protein